MPPVALEVSSASGQVVVPSAVQIEGKRELNKG